MAQVPPTSASSGASINTQTHQTSTQTLPAVLREGAIKQPIEGRIAENRSDGTTRIDTRYGSVEIRIKSDDKPPVGTKVQIEVSTKGSGQAQIKIQITPDTPTSKPDTPPQPAQPAQQQNTNAAETQSTKPTSTTQQQTTTQPVTTKTPEANNATISPSQAAAKAAPAQNTGVTTTSAATNAQQTQNISFNRINAEVLQTLEQTLTKQIAPMSTQRPPQIGDILKIISQPNSVTSNPQSAIENTQQTFISNSINNFSAFLKPLSSSMMSNLSLGNTALNSTVSLPFSQISAQSFLSLFNFGSSTSNTSLSNTFQPAQNAALSNFSLMPASLSTQAAPQPTQIMQPLQHSAFIQNIQNFITEAMQTAQQNAISTVNGTTAQNVIQPHSLITLQGTQISLNAKITAISYPTIISPASSHGVNTQNNINIGKPGEVIAITGSPILLNAKYGSITRIPVTLMNAGRPITGQFLLPENIGRVPAGTQLSLSINTVQSFAPNGQALSAPLDGLEGLMQAIDESDIFTDDILKLLETLQNKLPAESLNAALRFIPQAASPARLASTMLFFMAALKGGDIKQWLGDRHFQTLQNMQDKSLTGKLERGFSALSRNMNDPVSVQGGEWRSLQMPILFGFDLSKLQFHIRDYLYDNENAADEDENKPLKRVIIDFTMSHMGQMQIDSLLMNKRLETILRTSENFSATMKQDLRQRYTAIMRSIDYDGHLDFQTTLP